VPSAEFVLHGTNITVVFEGGAIIQVPSSPTFTGKAIASAATNDTIAPFLIVSANNIVVRNLHIEYTGSVRMVCGAVIGGGANNVKLYNAYFSGLTGWARYHSGYYTTSSAVTYDQDASGIQWFGPRSDQCGNDTYAEGGGSRFVCGSNSHLVGEVTEYGPEDTNCKHMSFSVNSANFASGKSVHNLERFGGYASFVTNPTTPCTGVSIEAAFARGAESVRIWGGKYDGFASAGCTGLSISASSSKIMTIGTEFWNCTVGWQVTGVASHPATGGNITLSGLKSIRCITGAALDLSNGGGGTIVSGLHVRDCIVDDDGANVTLTGLSLGAGSSSGYVSQQVVDFEMSGCDFSKVGGLGTPLAVSYGSAKSVNFLDARWRDNRGMTDQGEIVNSGGTQVAWGAATVGLSEIRANGSSSSPSVHHISGINSYRVAIPNASVAVTNSSGGSVSILHPDGSFLGTIKSGTSNRPVASTWYQLQGTGPTINLGSGNSANNDCTIYAIAPDGTVYVNGAGTFGDQPMQVGTLISWGPFTGVGPSVTSSTPGYTPVFARIQATTGTLPTTQLPFGAIVYFDGLNPPTTVTVKQGPTTITSPFLTYQSLGLTGDNPGPSTGVIYEVRGTPLLITSSGGGSIGINVYDEKHNLLNSSPFTSLTNQRLEPGYRIVFTFSGSSPVVTVAVAPG